MSKSKVFILSVLVLAVSFGAALAADLGGSIKDGEQNIDQVPGVWRGLYAGVTLGGGNAIIDVDNVGKDEEFSGSSFNAGIMAGYNFTNGPWLWGVEADVSGFDLGDKKKAVAGLGNLTADGGTIGSVRVRGGYVWNDVLLYGTAGVAFSDMNIQSSLGGKSEFDVGFVAGAGAEWAFDPKWTARIEGLAYGFGDEADTFAGSKRDIGAGLATVRVGVARRF
jgi:outer membrane immunogenic protein